MGNEGSPFILDTQVWAGGRLIGAMIPVGRIAEITFLSVEMGMEPGAMGIGKVLRDIVCSVPVAGFR